MTRSTYAEDAPGEVQLITFKDPDAPPEMKTRCELLDNKTYMPPMLLVLHAERLRICEQKEVLRELNIVP